MVRVLKSRFNKQSDLLNIALNDHIPATSLTISRTKTVLFDAFPFDLLMRGLASRFSTLCPFLSPRANPISFETAR